MTNRYRVRRLCIKSTVNCYALFDVLEDKSTNGMSKRKATEEFKKVKHILLNAKERRIVKNRGQERYMAYVAALYGAMNK